MGGWWVYSLDGVLDASDGQEGGQVGGVGGDHNEGEEPPDPHHHTSSKGGVRHLSAYAHIHTHHNREKTIKKQL